MHAASLRRSRKKMWVMIGIAAVVLMMICTLGFIFRWQIARVVAPEMYLKMSVSKTLALMSKENEGALNWDKFDGAPVSQEFSFSSEDMDVSMDGFYKYDNTAEKALLDISVAFSGEKYENNQMYISQDLLALSLPDIITDAGVLTIDPKTFAKDWKSSSLSDTDNPIPDLEEQIHAFFGNSTVSEDNESLSKEISKMIKDTNNNAKFAVVGTEDQNILGKNISLMEMTYTYSDGDVNELYQNILDLTEESVKLDSQEGLNQLSGVSDPYKALFDGLADMEVEEDIVVRYFVDQDGIVRKFAVEAFEVSDGNSSVEMGFSIELGGEKSPTDAMKMNFSFEVDGDKREIILVTDSGYDNGIYTGSLQMDIEENGSNVANMDADFAWEKANTTGKNLHANLTVGDDSSQIKLSVDGLLVESENEISLSDAALTTEAEGESPVVIQFAYKMKIINSLDIVIDTTNSISAWDYIEKSAKE